MAEAALEAIAKTAKWESTPQPSSKELFDYLREHAQGGVPKNNFAAEIAAAKQVLRADVDRTLRLLGCGSVADLDRSYVNVPESWRTT